jgi:hypothetical protein
MCVAAGRLPPDRQVNAHGTDRKIHASSEYR